jgi:large subunit ribosomal protein L9
MMEIILLENVRNLGKLGQIARVAPGYARNFLIPYGKALPATSKHKEFLENQRQNLERQALEKLEQAQTRSAAFQGLSLKIFAQASPEGKLFGSVKTSDLIELLAEHGHLVKKTEVRLDKVIREIGTYQYEVHLHPEVVLTLPIVVLAHQAQ